MILFTIALAWLIFVVLWAVRQTVEPSEGPWRPWRQRVRGPRHGPHGGPARGGARARGARRGHGVAPSKRTTAKS